MNSDAAYKESAPVRRSLRTEVVGTCGVVLACNKQQQAFKCD